MAKRANKNENQQSQSGVSTPSPTTNEETLDPNKNNIKDNNSQNRTQIIVAIIGVAGVILAAFISKLPAVSQPIATIASTILPTNTPAPTIILLTNTPILPIATQPTATSTPLGYYEDFSQGANWLPIGTPISNEEGTESHYTTNGIYHWDITTKANHTFSTSIKDLKFSNFEFEITFQKVEMSNPKDGNYGVRFRQSSGFFYVFYVTSDNGSYGLDKYSYKEKKYSPPVRKTLYPGINKNGNNTLKVITQGESIHLYINGALVERILDKSTLAGSFSLYSWLPYPNDSIKMEVGSISIIPSNSSSSLDIWPNQLADVQNAELQLSDVDDEMIIWVNGKEVITAQYSDTPAWIPFGNLLKHGDNIIEVSIQNGKAGQDCSGQLRLKLNGVINSAYQWFWDKDEAPANTECFHETVNFPLK